MKIRCIICTIIAMRALVFATDTIAASSNSYSSHPSSITLEGEALLTFKPYTLDPYRQDPDSCATFSNSCYGNGSQFYWQYLLPPVLYSIYFSSAPSVTPRYILLDGSKNTPSSNIYRAGSINARWVRVVGGSEGSDYELSNIREYEENIFIFLPMKQAGDPVRR